MRRQRAERGKYLITMGKMVAFRRHRRFFCAVAATVVDHHLARRHDRAT
jgi:hypothetical protein